MTKENAAAKDAKELESTLTAYLTATLTDEFEKRQKAERAEFDAALPSLVEKHKTGVHHLLFNGAAGAAQASPSAPRVRRTARPKAGAGGVSASRKSWSALSEADRKKWTAQIVGAGKAKAGRAEVAKKFEEAHGFKLRESIIDRLQLEAAEG